jgi:cyclopropane fatty-acyl-phospholipid synthase-like methyltransferase
MDYKETYTNLFSAKNYSIHNFNELRYQITNDVVKKNNVKNIIDIGSGRGVLLDFLIEENPEIKILSTDLENFHNLNFDFRKIDLSDNKTFFEVNEKYELLSCLDVLEHLEENLLDDVFSWFSKISENQVLTIANHSEILNGKEIHLIQENLDYWEPIILNHLEIISKETKVFYHMGRPHYLYILITKSKFN